MSHLHVYLQWPLSCVCQLRVLEQNMFPAFQVPLRVWTVGSLVAAFVISFLFLYSWHFLWWQPALPMGLLVSVLPHQAGRRHWVLVKVSLRGLLKLPFTDSRGLFWVCNLNGFGLDKGKSFPDKLSRDCMYAQHLNQQKKVLVTPLALKEDRLVVKAKQSREPSTWAAQGEGQERQECSSFLLHMKFCTKSQKDCFLLQLKTDFIMSE